jgi:hypothetical protein
LLLGGVHHLLVAIILVEVIALRALILVARTALAENAMIMVGILEIILSLDAVARKLRVPCHVLVFLEQLSGVAALTIVGPISRVSASVRPPLPPATATAATLSVVDQIRTSLTKKKLPLGFRRAKRR